MEGVAELALPVAALMRPVVVNIAMIIITPNPRRPSTGDNSAVEPGRLRGRNN